MITRGFYLGEIVDELAAIAAQVEMRNKLGFTDLTVFAENFFRDALNQLFGITLRNLNQNRSNEPGLDLGDEHAKLAFQVTSTATTAKIDATLNKISSDHRDRFERFIVLVVGKKQSKYSFDRTKAKSLGFSSKNIWDLDSLAREAVGLRIDRLEGLHRLVRAEVLRLKVELEIPDSTGSYPTSGYDSWEQRIKPKVGDGKAFSAFAAELAEVDESEIDYETIAKSLTILGRKLSSLPRVTREFLAMLLERRDMRSSKRFKEGWSHLLLGTLKREYLGSDLEGELDILEHADFVRIDGENAYDDGPPEVGVRISHDSEDLAYGFLHFVKAKGLSLRCVIGEGDLSRF